MIKMYILGGCNEAGRNMAAFEVNDDIIICDMGVSLTNLIKYNNEVEEMDLNEIIEKEIVADPKMILDKKDKVKAIVVSHAHLDHVGGVKYLASLFPKAAIYGTPFTIEVLKVLMKDQKVIKNPLKNKFVKVNVNSSFHLKSGLRVELINVTHSTPQSSMIVIHTQNGAIVYANDFKFDNRPNMGQKTNYDRLKQIGEEGVKLLVVDSLRSNSNKKTISEIVVKEMLRDVFISSKFTNKKGIVISTYASHISRLKSIVELNEKLGRKLIFMGRSLSKYGRAAKNAGIIDFEGRGVIVCKTPYDVRKWTKIANENKKDYLIVCTGHQGEDNAILSRMLDGKLAYTLEEDDMVVFSSDVIPVENNIEQSKILDAKIKTIGCEKVRDIHVSGHASCQDHRDLVTMLKPEKIIPYHGDYTLKEGAFNNAIGMGYVKDENVLQIEDQKVIEFI